MTRFTTMAGSRHRRSHSRTASPPAMADERTDGEAAAQSPAASSTKASVALETSLRADAPEFMWSPAQQPASPTADPYDSAPSVEVSTHGDGYNASLRPPSPSDTAQQTSIYIKHVGATSDSTPAATRRLLQNVFGRFGKVKSVQLARQPKSSAIINFTKPAAAAKAVVEAMEEDGISCNGQRLHVEYSRQKSSRKEFASLAEQQPQRPLTGSPREHSLVDEQENTPPGITATSREQVDEDTLLSSAICAGAWWEESGVLDEEHHHQQLYTSGVDPALTAWLGSPRMPVEKGGRFGELGVHGHPAHDGIHRTPLQVTAENNYNLGVHEHHSPSLDWTMSHLSPSLSPSLPPAALAPTQARAVGAPQRF